MDEPSSVEVLARGVCVSEGRVLLCYGRRSGVRYLPGGHVEFRESARQALAREMREETGLEVRVERFLGCCEHAFLQAGVPHAEINLVFEMFLAGVDANDEVASAEDWIGFHWHPLAKLDAVGLEPALLGRTLTAWLARPGGHCVSGDAWRPSL